MRAAYEKLRTGDDTPPGLDVVRDVVRDSWERSLVHHPDPERVRAPSLSDDELGRHRDRHPLAAVLPVIQRLLIEPSADTGVVVAIGDEHGRLLWVDGDRATLRGTDQIHLVPGTDWSEQAVGTSAPGTALVLGAEVQIRGAEHFAPAVQRWNCTAVPLRDPRGRITGVLDITGGAEAAGPRTLAWVRAAAAAAEAELHLAWRKSPELPLLLPAALVAPSAPAAPAAGRATTLHVLGRATGNLTRDGRATTLSLRHTELLTMLALHPDGLTSGELAELINPGLTSSTLRAELLRLRRVLHEAAPELVPESRPYRLPVLPQLDAQEVLDLLARGDIAAALRGYPDAVLPQSDAPGVVRLRQRVSRTLREAVLADASLTTVMEYLNRPETESDVEAWRNALMLLPPRSPRRAVMVAHLEHLQDELG